MLTLSQTILYYKKQDIQRAICDSAEDREVAVRYGENGFGKRPDILKFPSDVLEFAKKGASSFHVSEEIWNNPLNLSPEMSEREKNELRTGWDLVIDIDCHFIEYSKIAAELIVQALQYHGVNSITCKFSGNKGFHIGVPFEAFPKTINGKETKLLFPEAPRKIAAYITNMIKKPLAQKILELESHDFSKIIEKVGKKEEEIKYTENSKYGVPEEHLNPEPFLEVDTILISSRHLYRMPYSFNEKSGLVSIPIEIMKISSFKKEDAAPEKVIVNEKIRFLERANAREGEARELIIQAYDFHGEEAAASSEREDYSSAGGGKKEYSAPEMAIDMKYFPPCILNALKGLKDGKKRALFAMLNFLNCVSWEKESIEKLLYEWNSKNEEQLRETVLKGQIRYHLHKKEKILPQNCMSYYQGIGVCQPDNLCKKIKNPVQYSVRKSRFVERNVEQSSSKK